MYKKIDDKNQFSSVTYNTQMNTEPNDNFDNGSKINPMKNESNKVKRSRSQSPKSEDQLLLEKLQQQQEESIKQNQQLRLQLSQNSFYDKIELIQNRISQLQPLRDKLLEEQKKLKANIKLIDDKLKERAAYTGYEEQITRLENEAKRLKDKLKEIKLEEQKNEKKQRRQNKFLVMLEEDYRIICEEHGISASINLTRAQDIDHIEIKHAPVVKKQVNPKYPEVFIHSQIEPTEENIEKLQTSILEIKKNFFAEEKQFKKQINQLKQQLQQKEVELAQKMLQVRDKEHEVHVIQLKISEMGRNKISEKDESPEYRDYRDDITSVKSKSRKETHGLKLVDDQQFSFDDAEKIDQQRLTMIEVWYDKRVYGLRITYEETVTQSGRTDQENHRKQLKLDKNEYIQHIRIGVGQCVEYLLLKTNRESSLEVGKSNLKIRMADFLINKNESIHSFHGSFSSQGLIALGVTLHKKHLGSGSVNVSQVKSRIDNRYIPNPFYQL